MQMMVCSSVASRIAGDRQRSEKTNRPGLGYDTEKGIFNPLPLASTLQELGNQFFFPNSPAAKKRMGKEGTQKQGLSRNVVTHGELCCVEEKDENSFLPEIVLGSNF